MFTDAQFSLQYILKLRVWNIQLILDTYACTCNFKKCSRTYLETLKVLYIKSFPYIWGMNVRFNFILDPIWQCYTVESSFDRWLTSSRGWGTSTPPSTPSSTPCSTPSSGRPSGGSSSAPASRLSSLKHKKKLCFCLAITKRITGAKLAMFSPSSGHAPYNSQRR